MSYLDLLTIIGFVGADPEQRQARNNNGSKYDVSCRRHAAVVEEHRRRIGVENRMASRLRVPPAARSASRRRLRKVRTCSSRAASLAQRTNPETAKARKPRPTSRRSGAVRADSLDIPETGYVKTAFGRSKAFWGEISGQLASQNFFLTIWCLTPT